MTLVRNLGWICSSCGAVYTLEVERCKLCGAPAAQGAGDGRTESVAAAPAPSDHPDPAGVNPPPLSLDDLKAAQKGKED